MVTHVPQDEQQSGDDVTRRPRRLVPTWLLGLLLLAAGIFAGWQGHLLLRNRPPAAGPSPQAAPPVEQATTAPAEADVMDDPLAAAGLEALTGEPGGVAPPRAAKRNFGLQRRSADTIQQHASYEFPGGSDQAATHYLRHLAQAGLEVLEDSTDEQHGRVIVARGERLNVMVVLRAGESDESTRITVTAVRAAGDATSREEGL